MQRVEDEATRMGLLVEDLLLLARLDQERPLDRTPVDLLAVADDVVHDARLLAPDRRISLDVVNRPPVVTGDEARLRQVVHNLVANALRHTPAGTRIDVRVGVHTSGGVEHALLEVADAGPGLTPEAADRVFERFYRTDTARNREAGGTGLGLSIVAALVAAHGGRVTVDSTPGAGATFRVELPIGGSQDVDSEEPDASQPGDRA
jgi:two-component system OmpR family sensor kinase